MRTGEEGGFSDLEVSSPLPGTGGKPSSEAKEGSGPEPEASGLPRETSSEGGAARSTFRIPKLEKDPPGGAEEESGLEPEVFEGAAGSTFARSSISTVATAPSFGRKSAFEHRDAFDNKKLPGEAESGSIAGANDLSPTYGIGANGAARSTVAAAPSSGQRGTLEHLDTFDDRLRRKLSGEAETRSIAKPKYSSQAGGMGSQGATRSTVAVGNRGSFVRKAFEDRLQKKLSGEVERRGNDESLTQSMGPGGAARSTVAVGNRGAFAHRDTFDDRLQKKISGEMEKRSIAGAKDSGLTQNMGSYDTARSTMAGVPTFGQKSAFNHQQNSFDDRPKKNISGGVGSGSIAGATESSLTRGSFGVIEEKSNPKPEYSSLICGIGSEGAACSTLAEPAAPSSRLKGAFDQQPNSLNNRLKTGLSGGMEKDSSNLDEDSSFHEHDKDDAVASNKTEHNQKDTAGTYASPLYFEENSDDKNQSFSDEGADGKSPPIDSILNDTLKSHDSNADAISNLGDENQMQASVRVLQPGWNDDSMPFVPEAVLVGDGDDQVVLAMQLEPEIPWMKQRRTRILLSLVLLLLIAVFAVVFGLERSRDASVSVALSLSVAPSASPSYSASPSSAPSACAYKISSKRRRIDLGLSDPLFPHVALDGNNMVVVVQDGLDMTTYTIFYLLKKGEWIMANAFMEDYYADTFDDRRTAVALSGKTAMVGVPSAGDDFGVVSVYVQNDFFFWEKVEDPFIFDDGAFTYNFGQALDVWTDLACLRDIENMYLFRWDGRKWVQFDVLVDTYSCSIAGDMVAVDRYNSSMGAFQLQLYQYKKDGLVPLQDPIMGHIYSIGFSSEYLVYCQNQTHDHLSILRREGMNETFTFMQQLNLSVSSCSGSDITLNNDVLVIPGEADTQIFSVQNGQWEEAILFNRPFDSHQYQGSHQLSGKNLLVTSHSDVYFYNIEECAPEPTQMPSSSVAPTSCFTIHMEIVYDDFSSETSWKLQRIGADDDVFEILSRTADHNETSHTESLCLERGKYQITFYDAFGDGMCCSHGEGSYNITAANGLPIAQGGEFESRERSIFSLPFISAPIPSQAPSSSQTPSLSRSPSIEPSVSQSPTETCIFVEVDVFSDGFPGETSWSIQNAFIDGTDEKNMIYESFPTKLDVGGKFYRPVQTLTGGIFESSVQETLVNGVLCDCGIGTTQCECQGEVCLVYRGDGDFDNVNFYEKVTNCEKSGALALIIYNNNGTDSDDAWMPGCNRRDFPVVFVSQHDGQYLVQYGLGKATTIAVSQFNADILHSRRICLPEGDYTFTIYDHFGDGICCHVGDGRYNVTSNGEMIAQGGTFGHNETTTFSIPFQSLRRRRDRDARLEQLV